MRAVALAALAALLGCSDEPGSEQVEPKPTACLVVGASFRQCYDGWSVTMCTPPNQFLLNRSCADEGLCRDSCSGTWVSCDKARKATDCTQGGSGNSNEGALCSKDSDCAAGLICRYYLENAKNDKRCFRPCTRHADCPGVIVDAFSAPLSSCLYCEGRLAEPVCVPLIVCGAGSLPGGACDQCLDTCRGLPSCCTGSGCMCDDEC